MDENAKIIFEKNLDSNLNINQKSINKKRNPSVDVIRLIGMYIIILNHLLFIGNAFKKYPNYKTQLLILHILTDWHNNGFILISGMVGYETNKYSNLLYLWLTVFFIFLFIWNWFIFPNIQKRSWK